MPLFRRKKREEKVEAPPKPVEKPKEEGPSLYELAEQFLEANKGELHLAWFAEQEGFPFEPPARKFVDFIKSKGVSPPNLDEARRVLDEALRAKISQMSGPYR